MILSAAIAAIFFYFLTFVLKIDISSVILFTAAATIVHIFHKKKHFKTAQLSLFFLYAVIFLFWLKGYPLKTMGAEFVYLLSSASMLFCVSDVVSFSKLKSTLKWAGWVAVGISTAIMMNVRFDNLPLSIIVGAAVILIALRDRDHGEEDKDRA